jgi:hypothetical protein
MDVLDEDILSFWRELNNNKVEYIMIGGFAAILHGVSRITQDVDIWIKDTVENRQKLRKTIADLNLGDYKELETMEFVPGWTTVYLTKGLELDIYTSMKAFSQASFEECAKKAVIAEIESVPVPFLHINDLLKEKAATARPKDLLDVEELNKIKELSK